MGCDIHAFIERRAVAARSTDHRWEFVMADRGDPRWGDRNYQLFAALAGVRGEGPDAKGLPTDISDLVQEERALIADDGHSDSWHEFWEALALWIEFDDQNHTTNEQHRLHNVTRDVQAWQMFGHVPLEGYDYRIVYWFDN